MMATIGLDWFHPAGQELRQIDAAIEHLLDNAPILSGLGRNPFERRSWLSLFVCCLDSENGALKAKRRHRHLPAGSKNVTTIQIPARSLFYL